MRCASEGEGNDKLITGGLWGKHNNHWSLLLSDNEVIKILDKYLHT